MAYDILHRKQKIERSKKYSIYKYSSMKKENSIHGFLYVRLAGMLAFMPISKARENKLLRECIFRQFTYIYSSQVSGKNMCYNKCVV